MVGPCHHPEFIFAAGMLGVPWGHMASTADDSDPVVRKALAESGWTLDRDNDLLWPDYLRREAGEHGA